MGTAQSTVNKPSQAKFILIRNFDGSIQVIKQEELNKLITNSK